MSNFRLRCFACLRELVFESVLMRAEALSRKKTKVNTTRKLRPFLMQTCRKVSTELIRSGKSHPRLFSPKK